MTFNDAQPLSQSPQTRSVTRFKADGEFKIGPMVAAMLAGAVVGLACGAAASYIGFHFISIIILFPIVVGIGVGLGMYPVIQKTKTRNSWGAGCAAIVAGLVAIVCQHYCDYQLTANELAEADVEYVQLAMELKQARLTDTPVRPELEAALAEDPEIRDYLMALQVESFPEFLDYEARVGIELGKPGGKDVKTGVNLGYTGTILFWILEALLLLIAAAFVAVTATKAPFCKGCEQWLKATALGTLNMKSAKAAKIIESGDILALQNETGKGETDIDAFTCPSCGSIDNAIICVKEVSYNNGSRNSHTRARLVLPDDAMLDLAEVLGVSSDHQSTLDEIKSLQDDVAQFVDTKTAPTQPTLPSNQVTNKH